MRSEILAPHLGGLAYLGVGIQAIMTFSHVPWAFLRCLGVAQDELRGSYGLVAASLCPTALS